MPFWTLRRKLVAAVTVMDAVIFGWAAVVVAVALTGAHDEARSADAIAVLGAAQYNGRPSPVFRARLDHAAALYQRGLAPVVLVTGGVGSGDTVSESEVGRRYLLKAGLPEGAVVGLPAAASTRSEEHTSELQSPCNLVCRLLLEKKNIIHPTIGISNYYTGLVRLHER